jgi:CO/xanthine dehydrogenase Mo-binding subunit
MLTANFSDYLIPNALDVPTIEVDHLETPSPYTAYGIKGAGEGGRMLSPALVSAAIEDALSPFGVQITELPITPDKIVRWVHKAQMAGIPSVKEKKR